MKRVTIPLKENDNLVLSALASLRNSLKNLNIDNNDEVQYAIFDLSGLMGIFSGEFKVTIEIEQEKIDSFVSLFGVDFPEFGEGEIVDVTPTPEVSVDVVAEKLEPKFMYLAYVEDGELTFALKSNCLLPGFENMGDSDDDDDMKFTSYKVGKPGEVISHGETPFFAVPTNKGWVIIENGEVLEEIEF